MRQIPWLNYWAAPLPTASPSGPQQGRKAFMLQTLPPLNGEDRSTERAAKAAGFSLHAGVSCEAHQLDKRERLCRYISRPPVAVKRLSLSRQGKVVYTLKTPYRDGTTQVVLEPPDFIARLAALVPRPRVNLTRYHGVLAPNHRWRGAITPAKRGKIETCVRCGGPVKVLAAIEDQDVIDHILAHLPEREASTPAAPLLVPPPRAPPSAPAPANPDTSLG